MRRLGRDYIILRANEHRAKPPIPELPKGLEELNQLSERRFKILCESRPLDKRGGEYHPGGVAVTDVEMECPFCGMQFRGVRESGCFAHDLSPSSCPNCDFPNNVIRALRNLVKADEKQ